MNGATGELGLKTQINNASPASTTMIGIIHQSFRFLRNSTNSDKNSMFFPSPPPFWFERRWFLHHMN
jgi:hypothetical protein